VPPELIIVQAAVSQVKEGSEADRITFYIWLGIFGVTNFVFFVWGTILAHRGMGDLEIAE
jgi:hypothetical protein